MLATNTASLEASCYEYISTGYPERQINLNQTFVITLSQSEHEFIRKHLTDDVRTLLLRTAPAGLNLKKLALQIAARQKAKQKLPTWFALDELVFPPALSVEQASSEQTAQYKASLVSGKLLIDLTGGMGVDTWAFARRMVQVIYVERDPELAGLAAHNLPLLGAANVSVHTGDGLALLSSLDTSAYPTDWIYLDPHRRDETGSRVVQLQDCEPDITQVQTLAALQTKAKQILVKVSPLLDIDLAMRQVEHSVQTVHIVAVQGEVKEILLVLNNQKLTKERIKVNTVNLSTDKSVAFDFHWHEERSATTELGDPEAYIYEPNAAVLKAGAFRLVGARFNLKKLAPHSHLYTSPVRHDDFPGRIFSLQQVIKPDHKALKLIIPDLKANLTVRNFPQSVAELRKKLSLREGGDVYVLATTLMNGDKRLLITKKAD